MKSRRWLAVVASSLLTACTYKEYNTYNEVRVADAGVAGVGTSGGASGGASAAQAGASGSGGASAAQAGAAGASSAAGSGDIAGSTGQAGAAGSGSITIDECAGCLRLTMTPNSRRDLALELPTSVDFSRSLLTWRVRVRDMGEVSLTFYWQSGDAPEDSFARGYVSLNEASGWQLVGDDLSNVPDFALPIAPDAGVVGFEGFPFDKTRVTRVGMVIQPNAPSGILTPLTLEIDSLAFSDHPSLDVSFASNDGGLRLLESEGTSLAGATLEQIDE